MEKGAGGEVAIHSLPRGGGAGSVQGVTLLGGGPLRYKQDSAGLTITLPES